MEPEPTRPDYIHEEVRLRPLLGYIGLIRDDLRMGNWDVILHRRAHDEEDVHAMCWWSENHFSLNIALDRNFFDLRPATIRNTVVHELTHAQHRDLSILWESCTLGNQDVPASQAQGWNIDFHIQVERFVGWTTDFIAPTMAEYRPGRQYAQRRGCYIHGEEPN